LLEPCFLERLVLKKSFAEIIRYSVKIEPNSKKKKKVNKVFAKTQKGAITKNSQSAIKKSIPRVLCFKFIKKNSKNIDNKKKKKTTRKYTLKLKLSTEICLKKNERLKLRKVNKKNDK
jgi:hypothetical protein